MSYFRYTSRVMARHLEPPVNWGHLSNSLYRAIVTEACEVMVKVVGPGTRLLRSL